MLRFLGFILGAYMMMSVINFAKAESTHQFDNWTVCNDAEKSITQRGYKWIKDPVEKVEGMFYRKLGKERGVIYTNNSKYVTFYCSLNGSTSIMVVQSQNEFNATINAEFDRINQEKANQKSKAVSALDKAGL